MLLRKIAQFFSLSLLIVSCGGDEPEGKELKLYVSSFLNNNKDIVMFGSVNVKSLLDKTGYQGNDKLKVLIGTEIDKVNKVLNIDSPLFYALEGPFKEDGSPEALHLFLKVKNKDSLITELNSRSFDINEVKGISYTDDGDFVLGIRNDLAIVTVKADFDAKQLVKANFDKVDGDEATGKIKDMLNLKGDMTMAMNLENLYLGSNTDLEKLSADKKKEIKEMVKGSYMTTVFRFEKGAATMETKNLFSQKLMDKMFFRNDNSNTIFNKLNKGDGMMIAAASVNIDVSKLENFMADYSPNALDDATEKLGIGGGLFSMMGSENVFSKLSDGQMGISLFGNPMDNSFGVNTFLGTTDSGKMLFSMMQEQLPKGDYDFKDDGVYGNFDMTFGPASEEMKVLKLPKGCEDFGKKGISVFLNFQGIDLEEFGFEGEMRLMEIVEYATFEYDNKGGKLYIKAKKGQENVLKQAMDVVLEDLMDKMGNMSIAI